MSGGPSDLPGPDLSLAVDYTPAAGHAPGTGRYVRELVRALVREATPDLRRLRLVEVGRAPRPMAGAALGLQGPGVLHHPEHRQLRLPRRAVALAARIHPSAARWIGGGCQLFHRSMPAWPPAETEAQTLAVAEFPSAGDPGAPAFEEAVRRADGLLVFSSEAASRLARSFGAPPSKIFQVPVGTDHWERDLPSPPERRPTRDVLVLGAVRRSRHPVAALRAFEALRQRGSASRLLLVGRPGDAAEEFRTALRASPVASDVRWIEAPDEARMPACVGGAQVLLHLTDDEATPVTPLEAGRHGLGVVASPTPAFKEALGTSARFVDPGDPAGVAAALEEVLDRAEDPQEREGWIRNAAPYTWRACALAHLAAWKTILQGA